VDDVQAFSNDFQRGRHGARGQWMHQMRPDLGRLDAEILQVGPFLAQEKCREHFMRVFRIAAVFALLAGPAYAQNESPHINLLADQPSKTPEQLEQEAAQQKAYKDSLRKIPEAKTSSDPWGNVRSADTPKTSAPAKPKTKTGSTAKPGSQAKIAD
jgi:hypothetical protein